MARLGPAMASWTPAARAGRLPSEIPLQTTPRMLPSAVERTARELGFWLHCLSVWREVLEMAEGKGTARARRSRPVQALVSQGNRVNLALPFSMIRADEPAAIRAADWISLAGLVVSVVGFSVVIKELIRVARAAEGGQASHQVSPEQAASLSGGSASPDA